MDRSVHHGSIDVEIQMHSAVVLAVKVRCYDPIMRTVSADHAAVVSIDCFEAKMHPGYFKFWALVPGVGILLEMVRCEPTLGLLHKTHRHLVTG